jgi:hypothetical protein
MKGRWRWGAGVAFLGLTALIGAPFVRADRYRDSIQGALERSLGRNVTAGKVRLTLWRGPGLTLSDVTIGEAAAFGVEPVATVPELEVGLAWLELLRGRFEPARLRLSEASINIVRNEAGAWNVAALFGAAGPNRLPELEIRNGRFNLKLGEEKTILCVRNLDMEIRPQAGRVAFRAFGQPARTDRAETGLGAISAEGAWDASGRLNGILRLERTAISELMTLARGAPFPSRGYLVSRAAIDGPLERLVVKGVVQSDELQRFEIATPWSGKTGLRYDGLVDLSRGSAQFRTVAAGNEPSPVAVEAEFQSMMQTPAWSATASLNRAPLREVVPLARHLGLDLPEFQPLKSSESEGGVLTGSLRVDSQNGLTGGLQVEGVAWQIPELGTVSDERVAVSIRSQTFEIPPVTVTGEAGSSAVITASYRPLESQLWLRLTATNLPVDRLREWARASKPGPPFGLDRFQGGLFNGEVELGPAGWNVSGQILRSSYRVEGLSAPVTLASATLKADGNRIAVDAARFQAGPLRGLASGVWPGGTRETARLKIELEEADLPQVERLLLPALRPSGGNWPRGLFRRDERRPEPWLLDRRVVADVRVARLGAPGLELTGAVMRLDWQGDSAVLALLDSAYREGRLQGSARIDLGPARPAYSWQASASRLAWWNGSAEFAAEGETAGIGPELLQNLKCEGSFAGSSWSLLPEGPVQRARGRFEFHTLRGVPRLKFDGVQLFVGSDSYKGSGTLEQNNRLLFELSSGSRNLRLAGSLIPLQLAPQSSAASDPSGGGS